MLIEEKIPLHVQYLSHNYRDYEDEIVPLIPLLFYEIRPLETSAQAYPCISPFTRE